MRERAKAGLSLFNFLIQESENHPKAERPEYQRRERRAWQWIGTGRVREARNGLTDPSGLLQRVSRNGSKVCREEPLSIYLRQQSSRPRPPPIGSLSLFLLVAFQEFNS